MYRKRQSEGAVPSGNLAGDMAFDEIQREYAISAAGIRAVLKFAVDSAHNG